jgi:hypothetical protein
VSVNWQNKQMNQTVQQRGKPNRQPKFLLCPGEREDVTDAPLKQSAHKLTNREIGKKSSQGQ